MATRRPVRPPFDPRHEFVATPPAGRTSISIGGVLLLAGEQLDKRRVTPRRLQQMYDARLIAVAAGSTVPGRAARLQAIGPTADPRLLPPEPAAEPAEAQAPASRPRAVSRKRLSRAA